jgi:hypothetical protein
VAVAKKKKANVYEGRGTMVIKVISAGANNKVQNMPICTNSEARAQLEGTMLQRTLNHSRPRDRKNDQW